MPNKEHMHALILAIASMSMALWNKWRLENPSVRPDFLGVELTDVDLSFANMSYADLSHADLSRTNLRHATLRHSDLSSTRLQKADLTESDLSFSILRGADLRGAILRNANLRGTDLVGAKLKDADLRGAEITDIQCDPNVIAEQKRRFGGGVSYLEKLALGLFTRVKGKHLQMPDQGAEARHLQRHI
jgi:hypothetical protein